ncbi:MAG: hypothetical protein QXR19_11720 [Candidatus Jordarchaeaceae archaeon]
MGERQDVELACSTDFAPKRIAYRFLTASSQKAAWKTKEAREFRFHACYNLTHLPPVITETEYL